jgi:hydrogenase 3 maturation protease
MAANDLIAALIGDAQRIAVLGAGSELLADDAAGVMITDELIRRFGEKPGRFLFLSGSTAPECFTGEIKKFSPDLLLIIDAADMGLAPGELRSIDPAQVSGVSFSTHMLPLKVMLEYLQKETGCRTAIIGIQPGSLDFGGEMTEEVKKTIQKLIITLKELISENQIIR